MNRKFGAFTALFLVIALVCPAFAGATDTPATSTLAFEWKPSDDGDITIVRYIGENISDIVVPEEIDGRPVTSIQDEAFRPQHHLLDPNDPKRTAIRTIWLPDTVTSMGEGVFSYCSGLTSVRFPANLSEIPARTFQNCTSLTSVTFPTAPTRIGSYAFEFCEALTDISVPDSVSELEDGVFARCTRLESVHLPASIKSVPRAAFFQCASLQQIILPEKTTAICATAFARCAALQSVLLSRNLRTIESDSFELCYELSDIYYPGTPEEFSDIDTAGEDFFDARVHYNWQSDVLPSPGPYDGEDDYIYKPNDTGITIVGFTGSGISDLVIPKTLGGKPVTRIGAAAFSDRSFTTVVIPETVVSIGEGAFLNNDRLRHAALPNGLRAIESEAFRGCSALQTVDFPETLEEIGEKAYMGCSSITRIAVPNSVLYLRDRAFAMCTSLSRISLSSELSSLNRFALGGCSSLHHLIIPDGIGVIEDDAMTGCTSLEWIYLPLSMTSVGEDSFLYCDALTAVYYPGTQSQYNAITLNKGSLQNIEVHYESDPPEEIPAEVPDGIGLVDGSPLSFRMMEDQWILEGCTATRSGTAVAFLETQFDLAPGYTMTVTDDSRSPIAGSEILATGDLLWFNGDGITVFDAAISVLGDVTGSGVMNLSQLVRMAKAFRGIEPLKGPYLAAGDFGHTGSITLSDLVREAELFRVTV